MGTNENQADYRTPKRSRNDRGLLYFHDRNQAIPEWK
jgi:hypothetical protein